MKTHPMAIIAVAIATLLTASGQILYKIGMSNFVFGLELLTNWHLFLGLVVYGISAVILVLALKYGELSVIYPVVALSFVWVNILSSMFLAEPLNMFKWLGVVSIILGVSCIGFGSSRGVSA